MPTVTAPQPQPLLSRPCSAETMTCYAVLLRDLDREVLLERDGGIFTVPAFGLPRRQRVAPHLLSAVEKLYGLAANCRFGFTLQGGESGERCVVLEVPRIPTSDSSLVWVSTQEISWERIRSEIAREALRGAIEKAMAYNDGRSAGRFVQPGWFAEVQDWVHRCVAPMGFEIRGPRTQLNMGPDFSLICFDAHPQDIWFKAVDAAGIREFTITRQLAALALPHVPPLLATQDEWRAWLMVGCRGCPLDRDSTRDQWIAAARELAELQIASTPHSPALIEAGCLDLRAHLLEESIEPFLKSVAPLFDRQRTVPPCKLIRADLELIGKQVKSCCRELRQLEVPDSLGHSDLNPGNMLVDGSEVVFLDWMQGHVGNPLLSFEFLSALCRRLLPEDESLPADLRSEYLFRWRDHCPVRNLEHCSELVPLLAPFAFAMNFRGPTGWQPERPEVEALLRSLSRRMHVEAMRLAHDSDSSVAEIELD